MHNYKANPTTGNQNLPFVAVAGNATYVYIYAL